VAGEVVVHAEPGGDHVLAAPHGASVPQAAREFAARPGIAYATPNYVASGAYVPDDPGRTGTAGGWQDDQWSFLAGAGGIDATDAWSTLASEGRTPGAGTTVAVLDSGVAYRNRGSAFRADPDLAGTTFIHPRDFVDGDHLPLDQNGHGTHVAATIAEATNNGMGLTGLAYGARIMPVRVLDSHLHGSASQIAHGIHYAAANGARVINLSLAFGPAVTSCSQIAGVCRSIRWATRQGALVIAAAGNSSAASPALPAAAPKVLSVGATTARGCLAAYSNRRATIVAPGGGSDALVPGDPSCDSGAAPAPGIAQYSLDPAAAAAGNYGRFAYVELDGTSQATAEASATAADVIASGVPLSPTTGASGVARRMACTATHTGHPAYYGDHGRINAASAVDPSVSC
jgi:serine protease